MFQIDVLTAFVISGVGSFVAAGMTLLALPSERHVRDGLNMCSAAFLVLGVSLVLLIGGVESADDWRIFFSLTGSAVSVCLFTLGLARMNQQRIRRDWGLLLVVGVVVVMGVGWRFGSTVFGVVFVALTATIAVLAVGVQHAYILRPGNLAERVLGVSAVVFALSWLLRLWLTLQQTGPLPVHYVHVPTSLMPMFAIYYGIMPIFIATVVLSVVNAGLNERLAQRALTDELTGLYARRALREISPKIIKAAQRKQQLLAVLMLDLDHFKKINDTYGHLAGDDVLRMAAEIIQLHLRSDALGIRYGGEEFALLVPVVDVDGAHQTAQRILAAISGHVFISGATAIRVTCSIGLTVLVPDQELDSGLKCADDALYHAKESGRNLVAAKMYQGELAV
jgi:diguanylate cyclase (GGDEF)-like protein